MFPKFNKDGWFYWKLREWGGFYLFWNPLEWRWGIFADQWYLVICMIESRNRYGLDFRGTFLRNRRKKGLHD